MGDNKHGSEDNRLMIEGSYDQTLNAIALAMAGDSEITIYNASPAFNPDRYNGLTRLLGYTLSRQDNILRLTKITDEETIDDNEVFRKPFDIDNMIGLLLGLKYGKPVRFRIEKNEDFERKILIMRRVGAKLGLPEDDRKSRALLLTGFTPTKIKFNFQESNYYLADFLAKLCAVSDLEVEFLSRINVTDQLPENVFPFELEIDDLIPPVDPGDELQKRMRRLSKARSEPKFHYAVKRASGEIGESVMLPADPLVYSLAAVIGMKDKAATPCIGPLTNSEGDKALARILGRMGLKTDFRKSKIGDNHAGYFLSVEKENLTGKKIDEELIRKQPEFFGALAILSCFCEGKTILRGLSISSSLWKNRIMGIASILSQAGVRVGEIEDGFVVEPPQEFTDIAYQEFDDPYLRLVQFTAGICLNSKPLTADFFGAFRDYPHFQSVLDKIRPGAKSLAC